MFGSVGGSNPNSEFFAHLFNHEDKALNVFFQCDSHIYKFSNPGSFLHALRSLPDRLQSSTREGVRGFEDFVTIQKLSCLSQHIHQKLNPHGDYLIFV